MAEQGEYRMTHEPPNSTELMLLNAFIDQRVSTDLLRHKSRMFALLAANGLIARSNPEQRFLSRILSMYAQTKAFSGAVGFNGQIESKDLVIGDGMLNEKPFVALMVSPSKNVILRGPTRDTDTQAMESFIDTVLLTGTQWRKKIETQRHEHNAAAVTNEA
ncbi:hypothetical protein DE146DRAFT_681213 [Phaeosphaeria sp. MPI-PUGE-AT-0046c]|nr:hypothetical protein DE146DRAFT_681213 [Phaeosphaeria sp. MPI-PUGE-AT-0046c]